MTNQEVLEKAITKARAGGWDDENDMELEWLVDQYANSFDGYDLYRLIFNHDFVKALWGETEDQFIYPEPEDRHDELLWQTTWRYHLQQMVISSDPVRYLGEHLDG